MSTEARPTEVQPRLMRVAQAAAYMGVSSRYLVRLDIARKVIGSLLLYDRRDLDDWIDDQPYETPPDTGPDKNSSSAADQWLKENG